MRDTASAQATTTLYPNTQTKENRHDSKHKGSNEMTYYAYGMAENEVFYLVSSSTSLGDTHEDLLHIAQQHEVSIVWINNQFYYVSPSKGVHPMRLGSQLLGVRWTAELESKLLNMVNE